MSISNPALMKASAEFTQAIISSLATDQGVHAETAISAASRMTGTFVIRSCGLPLAQFAPGTPLLGDIIDEHGQKVLRTIDEALASMKLALDPQNLDYDLPEANQPRMNLAEVQSLLDGSFRAIADKYHLSPQEGAHAAAVATAMLIKKCSGVLEPHLGYTIAMYGMVEGSKTVPLV
jgi:hypothetical protein